MMYINQKVVIVYKITIPLVAINRDLLNHYIAIVTQICYIYYIYIVYDQYDRNSSIYRIKNFEVFLSSNVLH